MAYPERLNEKGWMRALRRYERWARLPWYIRWWERWTGVAPNDPRK